MQRNARVLKWYPHGASDALNSTKIFQGAMLNLSNLIPDPSTPDLWECRPAATLFGGGGPFSSGFSPGFQNSVFPDGTFISALKIAGNVAFGMVASALNPGFDQPFAFNLLTGQPLAVSGITALNVPISAPPAGAWTPPIMDLIGSKMIVTHPGFGATANFFGWFDLSNPSAPVWHAGNLTGAIQFTTIPTFVAQFNNRAYFLVNTPSQPAAVISDPLNGTNVTNASQVLTFGDNVPLNAIGQLRLYNQLGGIIQSLIVFKGVSNMYQVTGDPALGNLAVNALAVATGTLSPLGLAATKSGLAFVSPDGIRIIDYVGNVSDPIGHDGDGITLPFIFAYIPSRVVMAASGDVMRISTQNGNAPGTPFQEWWYDFPRKVWHGPHTFPASLILPWMGTFIMTPVGVNNGTLWKSDPQSSSNSTYVENGVQLNWSWQTQFFPDNSEMSLFSVSQSLLNMALSSSAPAVTVNAIDPNGLVLDTVNVSLTGASSIWGAFPWGAPSLWGAAQSALLPRQLAWHVPLVFVRLSMLVQGQSSQSVRIGGLLMRAKQLKYLADLGAVA